MRRRAYDAHLKTDILYSGRQGSMNATFDPYLHHGYGNGYGYGYGGGADQRQYGNVRRDLAEAVIMALP